MSENRKIAAILATDVVGYSRLVGEDVTWPERPLTPPGSRAAHA